MKVWKALAIFVCFALPAAAQSQQDQTTASTATAVSDAPKPKAFNRETIAELALVAGSLSADAMSSQKLREFPDIHEYNPLVPDSRIGTAAYFGATFALDVTGTYLLRKHNHTTTARIVNIAATAIETGLAIHNYRHVNDSNEECFLHHPSTGCVNGQPR